MKKKLMTKNDKIKERNQTKKRYWNKKNSISNWSKYKEYIKRLSKKELKKFKEKRKLKAHNYYIKNKVKIQKKSKYYNRKRIFNKYGITKKDYFKLLKKQNNKCAICKTKDTTNHFKTLPLVIDHDNKTKKVRGLLCVQCNIMLGMGKENPKTFINAIKYLKKYY